MAQNPIHPSTCQTCKTNHGVNWKCNFCGIYCCYRCGKTHVSFQNNTDHRVYNIKETHGLPMLKTVTCSIHSDKDISTFCRRCERFMCTKCLTESNSCEHLLVEVEDLHAEKIKDLDKNSYVIAKTFRQFFMKERERLDRNMKFHQENYNTERQKVKKHEKYLKDMITLRTNTILEDLDHHWKNVQSSLNELTEMLECKIQTFESQLSFIDEIKKCIQIDNICKVAKEINNVVMSENTSFTKLPNKTKKLMKGKVNLELVDELFGTLKSETISNIHFNVLNSYKTDLKTVGSIAAVDDNTIWIKSRNDSILRKIELVDELPKSLIEIKYSDNWDLTLLKSGDLLFSVYNDPCIKQITQSGELTTFYKFPSSLFSKRQTPLALHVNNDGTICVGTMEAGGEFYNLCRSSHRQVVALSTKGKALKVFELDFDGNRLFTCPRRITSNNTGDICVIDSFVSDEGRLVALASNGKLRWKYTGQLEGNSKFNPHDIVTTSNGNIITCDLNNTFQILNDKGLLIEYIDTKQFGIVQPVCIDIDHRGRLLTGCNSIANNDDNAKIHILIFTGF